MADDIVNDIMSRLAERLGADVCPPDVLSSLASEIRRDWAGDRVYITASPKRIRDANIRADYRRGVTMDQLALRHGISKRRVRQIIRVRD